MTSPYDNNNPDLDAIDSVFLLPYTHDAELSTQVNGSIDDISSSTYTYPTSPAISPGLTTHHNPINPTLDVWLTIDDLAQPSAGSLSFWNDFQLDMPLADAAYGPYSAPAPVDHPTALSIPVEGNNAQHLCYDPIGSEYLSIAETSNTESAHPQDNSNNDMAPSDHSCSPTVQAQLPQHSNFDLQLPSLPPVTFRPYSGRRQRPRPSLPVPVPNLTKTSRGRRVPTAQEGVPQVCRQLVVQWSKHY